jgi:hypothetical protein
MAHQGSERRPLPGANAAGKADPAERMAVTLLLRQPHSAIPAAHIRKLVEGESDSTRLSREQFEETSSSPRSPFRCCPLARRAGWPWRETDRGGHAAAQQWLARSLRHCCALLRRQFKQSAQELLHPDQQC